MTLILISSHEAQFETVLTSCIAHAKMLTCQRDYESSPIYLVGSRELCMYAKLGYNL